MSDLETVFLRIGKYAFQISEITWIEELDHGLNVNFKSGENVLVEKMTLTEFMKKGAVT